MISSPRLTARRRARRFATALLCVAPCVATAAVFGEALDVSAIGEPFRAEIEIAGDVARAGECLRIAAPGDESGLPWVRDGEIRALGTGRVVVSSPAPQFEPVVRLAVEDVCDTRLRREYTLLLAFPAAARAEQPAAASESAAAPRPPTRGSEPASRPAARRTASVQAPPTRARRGSSASSDTDARAGQSEQRPAGTSRPAPAKPPKRDDQLLLDGDAPAGADGAPIAPAAAERDRAPESDAEREHRMAVAVDRAIVAQLALDQRIRELEDVQRRLTEQLRLAAALPPAATASALHSDVWRWIAALLAVLSLLLAAALLAVRRRAKRHAHDLAPPTSETQPHAAGEPSVELEPPPPAWVRADPPPLPDPASGPPAREPAGGAPRAASAPPARVAVVAAEESTEEHESAIELAEIMMGFGRVQGAAETLAEFIQSNPKKAVTPWLKLLEVYRRAGLRPEFDALARQLNKTFNVRKVTWETFDEARAATASLEELPHVVTALTAQWRTREAQAYLETLLRDNRDGTREGFPLCVIDEILVLAAILEDELGAYRPDVPVAARAS